MDRDDDAMAATLASGEQAPRPDVADLTEPGRRIGRFVVLEVLGAGAMGIVVAAYDADLDRKVALKLIRPGAQQDEGSHGTERLLREARAMAKVAHPSVLAVHEVGLVADQVFVAMEFAAGGTLRAWCKAEPRPWRAALDRFVAAARGLEAAHQLGLVHRDFKPENVLLTAAGEVRVADFGLVGIHAQPAADDDEARPDDTSSLEVTLTRTGALLGTPAYMAPEQFNRADVGPAADQFALCASLWEALYGVRPYPGRTYWELAAAVIGGNLSEPPADRDVPAWLREVLRRGLRTRPDERWPSVAALVEALERDPVAARGRRLRRGAVGLSLAALGGLAVFGLTRGDGARVDCTRAAAAGATAWTADGRVAISSAFGARGAAWVAPTTGALDGWVGRWSDVRIDACRATHERGVQSPAMLDKRMGCLDSQLVAFAALASALGRADTTGAEQALVAVDRLPAPETCTAVRLANVAAPSDDPRALQVDRLIAEARAAVDLRAGDMLALVDRSLAAANDLGASGPRAVTLLMRAEASAGMDPAASRAALDDALTNAAASRDPSIEADIAIRALRMAAESRTADRVDALLPVARAAVIRAGDPPLLRFELVVAELSADMHLGRIAEAREACDRAIAISPTERREGVTAGCGCNLALMTRDNQASVTGCAAHVAATRKRYGDAHPRVVDAAHNYIVAMVRVERFDEADAAARANQAVIEHLHGARSIPAAEGLQLLAVIENYRGDLAASRATLERTLALVEEVGGPDHPHRAGLLMELSDRAARQGDQAAATRYADDGLAASERSIGTEHPEFATSLMFHASAIGADPAQLDRALASWDRAIDTAERTSGPQSIVFASVASRYASFLAGHDRLDAALVFAERGLAAYTSLDDQLNAARAQGMIGEMLLELGRRKEARAAFEASRDRFKALGASAADELATAEENLRKAR